MSRWIEVSHPNLERWQSDHLPSMAFASHVVERKFQEAAETSRCHESAAISRGKMRRNPLVNIKKAIEHGHL